MNKSKHVKYNDIEVVFKPELHGGGLRFGQQFIPVVKEKFGRVNHVFEFCAGPGFIGFSLLANNLCDKLTLGDINPEAIGACNETIKNNHLESRVTAYLSDGLGNIPETEKWDLVVSNPPHVLTASENRYQKNKILYDPNFRIHENFYRDIRKFLKAEGSVLFQEHAEATSVDDFRNMIEKNGLRIVEVFTYKNPAGSPNDKKPDYSIYLKQPWKAFDPSRIYRFLKRRINPNPTRNYYFIWCKIS